MEVFEAPLRIKRRRSPGGGLEGGGGGGEGGLEGGGLQVEVATASSQMVALRGRPQPHAHQR